MARLSIGKERLLDVKDILQINGTVIAGALVLLTFSSTTKIVEIQTICDVSVILFVGMTVLMFSFSCISAIISSIFKSENNEKVARLMSIFFMGMGFFVLSLAMYLIMVNSPNCNNPTLGQNGH